jgi:deazaflavin-dependent oxidoreductase (nitroreductase family)
MTETKVYKIQFDQHDWPQEHLRRYLATDGAEGHYVDFSAAGGDARTPTLILTTTGRQSGQLHSLPLIYGEADGKYVVIGSKGGAPQHPAWYLNLVAHPEVGVQVGGRHFRATARIASGAERQQLWDLMAGIYAPYNAYQQATAREIPVVVLEPLAR